jgi:hypothetical protein
MTKLNPKTSKMPGESEQQFIAWILYCETGSIPKMIKAWNQLRQGIGETSVVFGQNIQKMAHLPSQRNIEKWSANYSWVKRRELRLSEEMESLSQRAAEIQKKKMYLIAESFWDKLQLLRKQIRQGEHTTVDEVKKLWEMLRAESGESLGQHDIRLLENEQRLPTAEEDELDKKIDETIIAFYARKAKGRRRHPPLD